MPDTLENLFLSLSDKTRLKLLGLMADGEVSVGFLADSLGESQPKISRHLAYLRNAGLVSTRREGKWIYYAIERPGDETVANVLDVALGRGFVTSVPPIALQAYEQQPAVEELPAYEPEYVDDGWRAEELEVYLL